MKYIETYYGEWVNFEEISYIKINTNYEESHYSSAIYLKSGEPLDLFAFPKIIFQGSELCNFTAEHGIKSNMIAIQLISAFSDTTYRNEKLFEDVLKILENE
jgi:hypothetical protein